MRVSRRTVPRVLGVLALLAACLPAAPSSAQSFAVGAGGAVVNDLGSVARVSGFEFWGAHAFGELRLEPYVLLQARASRFTIGGSGTGAPNIRISAGTLTAGYLFSEEWFHAGIFGGLGFYFLRPSTPGPDEEIIDREENSFGWTGGLLAIFDIGPRWELRLEGSGHVIRSETRRKPILIGIGFAHRF